MDLLTSDSRVPPPRDITLFLYLVIFARVLLSISRKTSSPWAEKISAIDLPVCLEISSSVSTKVYPSNLAHSHPRVVLPVPGGPASIRFICNLYQM